MYKLAVKFLVITLVLTGACLALSSHSKAFAATTSCPAGDSVPGDWGNDSDGEGAGVMSSLVMKARDTSGNLLNPHFTLHSQAIGWPDNAQIYRWPIGSGGSVSNTDDWPQHGDFQFGTHLSGDGGISCNGWIVLGPGKDGNVGNGWVLNCKNQSGNNNIFWISHLDNPGGQSGRWEMLDSSGNTVDSDVNSGGGGYFNFNAVNGTNMRFTFVWHPDTPPLTTAACTSADISDEKLTNAAGKHSYTYVTIDGTDNNVSPTQANAAGVNGQLGWGERHVYGYDAIKQYVTVTVQRYFVGQASPYRTDTYSYHCYHATCNPGATGQALRAEGDGPGGIVQTGHGFNVYVTVKNTGGPPDGETIPSSVGGHNFSLTEKWDDYIGGTYAEHDTGFSLNPGDTRTLVMHFDPNGNTNSIRNLRLTFFPDLTGSDKLDDGESCYIDIPIYQEFNIKPTAMIDSSTDAENPYIPGTSTHGVRYIVGGSLDKGQTTTATTRGYLNKNGTTVDSHTTSDSYGTVTHQYDYPDSGFVAGTQYCPYVNISPGHGWHGPSGDAYDTDTTYNPGCMTITNRPYFKVNGSSASAGMALKQGGGTCPATGGGILAGWNNNANGQERGSGAQLSALALVKITGFASAQVNAVTNTGTNAAKLTFANNGAGVSINTDSNNPDLGGNFSSSPYCIDNVWQPGSGNTTTLPANAIYPGATNIADSRSIFVNGDVTITGNITYGPIPDLDHVPSFVLHATGNIKIAPGVTQLDGLFVSDQKIYTCANSSGPIASYTGCNNQLLVHGGFAASQIKLGRTYGSLRDEEPHPATPGTSVMDDVTWSNAGPIAGQRCTKIEEPSDPDTWYDNYLCVPTSSSLKLAWTFYENNSSSAGPAGWYPKSYLQSHGTPYCKAWNVSAEPNSHTWYDNYLCSNNSSISFGAASPAKRCKQVVEPSDSDWSGTPHYICASIGPGTGPTVSGPPFHCSNAGVQVNASTCAAEIFEYSPELYLSTPAIQQPNGGGSGPWDSVTGLPPVL